MRRDSKVAVLIRRREIWWPTAWGWLALLATVALLAFGLGQAAYPLLAPQAPVRAADGSGARTLVVEGWLDEAELAQAAAAFRRGGYERLLTTGGPLDPWQDPGGWKSFAERAAVQLRAQGIAATAIVALPAPHSAQDRTYMSALMVRDWAQRSGVALGAIDLYSAGVHTRRSWALYRMALRPEVEVGVLAAQPVDYDARRWWTSSVGAKTTLGEVLGLAWTTCCFWPAAKGSHEERWAVPAAPKAKP